MNSLADWDDFVQYKIRGLKSVDNIIINARQ